MAPTNALIDVLERELKARDITYADVARRSAGIRQWPSLLRRVEQNG